MSWVWQKTFAKVGEDWVFLAILGIIMAVVSFGMDYGIAVFGRSRMWLYHHMGIRICFYGSELPVEPCI